jgi:hypothetical protein
MMLEQLNPPPEAEFPAPSAGYRRRFHPNFDQGALVANLAGFGLAAICGFMASVAGPDPAFIVMLLTFGWLAAIVSVLATELKFGLPLILLAGLALGAEGIMIARHSSLAPPPVKMNDVQLKTYVKEFAARMRLTGLQYKSKFDEINRRAPNAGPSSGENDDAAANSEDARKLLLEEETLFKNQYFVQGKVLQGGLLKRLGPKYPEALYPPEDGRRASIAALWLMLEDGKLAGIDSMAQIANYLDDLANRLP